MVKVNLETLSWSFDDELGDEDPDLKAKELKKFMLKVGLAFAVVFVLELILIYALVMVFKKEPKTRTTPAKTMIVLGSGGHTAEMLKLVESLDKKQYSPRVYVVAETDNMSGRKAVTLEKAVQAAQQLTSTQENKPASGSQQTSDNKQDSNNQAAAGQSAEAAPTAKPWELYSIPRSREVGQSYITSVFTTLYALLYGFVLVYQMEPEVVLVNGPGTCIPVCVAVAFFRTFLFRPCKVIYVESIARTKKLSLTGKILYKTRIADLLLVQWEDLLKSYPAAKYAGRLY